MNNFLIAYQEKWFVPALCAGVCGIIGLLTLSIQNEVVLYLSLGVPFFALLASGILGIIRVAKKKYRTGILQLVLTGAIGIVGLYCVSPSLQFYPYDFYADSWTIPEDIELHIPKRETVGHTETSETDPNNTPEDQDFELQNSFQPGLYTVEIWLAKIDSGIVYLKAYQIPTNHRLSEYELRTGSEIVVGHSSDSLVKYETKDHFTIYEGDWGKPYAARVELWYKSVDSSEEVKLLEKNYKIEGWQR